MKNKVLLSIFFILLLGCKNQNSKDNRIQPWDENPWYWQYKGKPVMLLGASGDDNLFQWPAEILIPHLDSMKSVGANYVRCTMSDRQDKGFELYPFVKLENGKYNLEQLNDEYYNRFDFFLQETQKRDIIVQIEIWDRFDYARNHWPDHPFNPKNNINYTLEESGLDLEYPDHPARNKQPFFFTTPQQRNNKTLLKYQVSRVEKLLSVSLKYNHVLYCMDNETSAEEEWAVYWAEFILAKAEEAGKKICVTEMWDNWDLTTEHHKRTFDHPELYAFCDVSQNNQKKGQVHWDNFQSVKHYISSLPRPMNTVKTYGADGGRHGNTKNGLERWWRHVLGGAASVRFHRPTSGLGLSELSMNCVKVAREIESIEKFWNLEAGNQLLSNREENEVYLASKPGETYVLFFTNGGEVSLDLTQVDDKLSIKWFEIRRGEMKTESKIEGGKRVVLKAPGEPEWIAVISK
ncbi:MAG: putative collagen-binding domain-containing protein [Bacteroidota bacterium]